MRHLKGLQILYFVLQKTYRDKLEPKNFFEKHVNDEKS